MNKREFLAQGGALASGALSAPWLTGSAQAQPDAATPTPEHTAELSAGTELSTWRSRLGERFEVSSPLGRNVSLRLSEVAPLGRAHAEVEQFRLSFEGPRHLPLGEGLHALRGADNALVHLHLQPVRAADGLRYQAHFSLIA